MLFSFLFDSMISSSSIAVLHPPITLYNRTLGCRGLPLMSRRCVTKGSNKVSSPLLSNGGWGEKCPLILLPAQQFISAKRFWKHIQQNYLSKKYQTPLQTLKVTPPNPSYCGWHGPFISATLLWIHKHQNYLSKK